MEIDAVWTALRWPGLEHAVLTGSARGQRLDSLAVVVLDGQPLRISCQLAMDSHCRVRRLRASVSGVVTPVDQRYTCTGRQEADAGYRYESGDLRADLRVDPCGLVLDYPGLWHRVQN